MRKAKPSDLVYSKEGGAWAVYDHHGQKIALVFDAG